MEVSDSATDGLESIMQTDYPLKFTNIAKVIPRSFDDFETLRHLDTAHPRNSEASIRTLLQVHLTDHSRARLVVQGGPDSAQTIHATFEIDGAQLADVGPGTFGWAKFSDHSILYVLVNALTLTVFDVYPGSDLLIGSEGWTISLPFECSGAFGMGNLNGLLLQRIEGAEDALLADTLGEDDFILRAPSKFGRMDNTSFPTSGPEEGDFPQPVSSLFSLSHPLEDVLPVSQVADASDPTLITDAFEKIIWIGTSRHDNEEKTLVLTFHSTYQRHAVYAVETSPTVREPTPLHLITRNWCRNDHAYSSLDFVLPNEDSLVSQPVVSRDEALADALGVRKTPHSASSRPRARESEAPHTSNSAHMSFFSAADVSVALPIGPDEVGDASHLRGLEPKWALRMLFKEENKSSLSPVDSVFLVSNSIGSGLSTIAMFAESRSLLRLWSISEKSVTPIFSTQCRSALPIEVIDGYVFILMDREFSLILMKSDQPICPVEGLPDFDTLTLSDPVKDRVAISGEVRATLSLALQHPLVCRVLSVWDSVLPEPVSLAIRVDIIRLGHVQDADAWNRLQALWRAMLEGRGGESQDSNMIDENESDWKALLASDYHQSLKMREEWEKSPSTGGVCSPSSKVEVLRDLVFSKSFDALTLRLARADTHHIQLLFDSTFLLYEDLNISATQSKLHSRLLADILTYACNVFSKHPMSHKFLKHFASDARGATEAEGEGGGSCRNIEFTSFTQAPSFCKWMKDRLGGIMTEPFLGQKQYKLKSACPRIRTVDRVLSALLNGEDKRDLHVVHVLLDEGYRDKLSIQEAFCTGLALPLLDVLHRCRYNPELSEGSWSAEAWALVDRLDLSWNTEYRYIEPPQVPFARNQLVDDSREGDDSDGLLQLEVESSMLFLKDNRVKEAARLLRSSAPVPLHVARPVEVTDHDFEKQKQARLLMLARRTLALPFGRGMLTIGGMRPVPAEPLPLPDLCLRGRLPPSNATIALDMSECPADFAYWPNFHNGVAAGLRLPLPSQVDEKSENITRTWILYNRPQAGSGTEDNAAEVAALEAKRHVHAGVLLGLGLRGHLIELEMSDIYDYLTKGTVTTTVGMLLGLAANKRGSCDLSVSKTLCLHIPSLIPHHFSAIDVASTVQAAAVLGAGLLYQRSSHRMMTEFLLSEIGRRPESDVTAFDREAYTLSCGVALGMVNLCLGLEADDRARAAGISDLHVEDRLFKLITGGIDNEESQRTRETNDRFSIPYGNTIGDAEKCCVTYEGDAINTDVTSPGAVIALGLMYMKSGNQTIASALELPQTHFLLEFIRPDFLTLRVVSRALVLWDWVSPSREWVASQMPVAVASAYEEMKKTATCAGTGSSPDEPHHPINYDRRAVRQIYVHVIAGSCFGMGLRYAGTGDNRAKAVIMELIAELANLRDPTDPVSMATRPEVPILETCLGLASLSLSLVLAGTGDLDALRLLRVLQWRCDDNVSYGNHMVFGMSIGLLNLGGGKCTIGREPEDIAALVAALFPRFPSNTMDNQSHLQAARHLYALAVKRREVVAVDVDSGEPVHVEARVLPSGQVFTTPFLLRNYDEAQQYLEISSKDYFPLKVPLTNLGPHGKVFFVKRKHRPVSDEDEETLTSEAVYLEGFGKRTRSPTEDLTFDYLCDQLVKRGIANSLPTYLSLATGRPESQDLKLSHAYVQSHLQDRDLSLIQDDLFDFVVEKTERQV